jgi:hypothetical protein
MCETAWKLMCGVAQRMVLRTFHGELSRGYVIIVLPAIDELNKKRTMMIFVNKLFFPPL